MNYRHAFHAGNFADVVKHAALVLLIERLKEKEAAFRIIDTHAGAGFYDVTGSAASRTGEWRNGIGRVLAQALAPSLEAQLKPYLDVLTKANGGGTFVNYPGSPWIARQLLRPHDRLTAIELHPRDASDLRELFAGDRHVKTITLDGWLALGSFVPPKERRGIVLVDPPFEERDDFDKLVTGLQAAHRRWPTGVYALWYPVKDIAAIDRFCKNLLQTRIRRLLRAELFVRSRETVGQLNGTGLIVCNPPWKFKEALSTLLAGLSPHLADGLGAGQTIDVIAGE